jgi:hypothetical protein
MADLIQKQIQDYRAETFKLASGQRVRNRQEAVKFVLQRGFTFFWPIKDITLPSLWTAVAGDRPVADKHDDPGHITWRWKDSLLGSDQWYYSKVLRKRATMIAPEVAPYFYALSENYGSPEDDYLTLYEQGHMTQEAKAVYEAILDNGPLNTVALRRAARLTSRESDSRFNRALTDLQVDFKLVPIGVAEAGAWNYAFIYEIVARHYPDLPEQARFIGERQAREKLSELYFRSVGAAQIGDLAKLFRWRRAQAERAVDSLSEAGLLRRGLETQGQEGEWIALEDLLQAAA